MERIAAILVIFVLLMNGRHVEPRLPQAPRMIEIEAKAISFNRQDPHARFLGPLRYLGGWSLTSSHEAFGGLSSLRVTGEGDIEALSDTGELFFFRAGLEQGQALLMPLPALPEEREAPKWKWDTESQTTDPKSGRHWVGFELTQRICRYSPGFRKVEACVEPEAMADWPPTTGIESMQRLPDGRFLAIAEWASGPYGVTEALLFSGDPTDPATPPPSRLRYQPPEGYLPTDLLWLGEGRMLVMNRRVTLFEGFTGVLTLVDAGDLREGQMLRGPIVARFAAPYPHDNFEALALSREDGQHILWIASDDNHMFFQRTLLLKFALPPEWFAGAEDPQEWD